MSTWIIVISLIFSLLIILEEAGPSILKHYLNQTNNGKQLKMKKRMIDIIPSFMKKLQSDGSQNFLSRNLKKDLMVSIYKAFNKSLQMIKSGYGIKAFKTNTNHEMIRYLKRFSITKVIKK
ncbi:hypothetical protein PH210_28575 [Paenibacillus sp. BSR1-1]|uniref:hypothetical protein n=1 Tax=Paenibacillus sp. BSR1-1 TaxID=3020845 RepID=UPI0025B25B4E|nr:hypothetical protein [Paenibacillus sp. BSR1-1]MDN3020101.1 hypothetical protein [Paenibacillus sp. BSR1-1]